MKFEQAGEVNLATFNDPAELSAFSLILQALVRRGEAAGALSSLPILQSTAVMVDMTVTVISGSPDELGLKEGLYTFGPPHSELIQGVAEVASQYGLDNVRAYFTDPDYAQVQQHFSRGVVYEYPQ